MAYSSYTTSSASSTSASSTSDEFELLCVLAATPFSAEKIERIARWNWASFNWNKFRELGEYHGVLPLCSHNLLSLGGTLPSAIESSLRSAYDSNLRRSLWFAAELSRIMQHFRTRQLRVVPFKGPVLAHSLYGDIALRSFSDLDFLLCRDEAKCAAQALSEIGYVPSKNEGAAVERLCLRIGYERSFDGAAGKNLVELQWALVPHYYAVNLKVEDLIARAITTVTGDHETPCMSPEDSLLMLCLHAAKHLWMRLIWVTDIAQTLRTQSINYPLVLERARALGLTRILAVSFLLAKNILGVALRQAAEEIVAADPSVGVLSAEFANRLALGITYNFESTEYFRLTFKLRERRADRWRYLWRLLVTPGTGDVAAVKLPEALFPLYRVVRMGRLARKLI